MPLGGVRAGPHLASRRAQLRGIQVGQVLNVQPHLDRVDVLMAVDDEATVIPRNSRLYANQSGLIAEPLVDIMPQARVARRTKRTRGLVAASRRACTDVAAGCRIVQDPIRHTLGFVT